MGDRRDAAHTIRVSAWLALGLAVLGALLFILSEISIVDAHSEQAMRSAEQIATDLDRDLGFAIIELEAMAELDAIRGLDRQEIDRVLAGAELSSQMFGSFTVLDASGTVVARPSKPERIGEDRSSRDYARAVTEQGVTYVGDVFVTEEGNYGLSVATPLAGTNGEPVGLLMGSLRLADRNPGAYSTILEPPIPEGYEAYLLSRDALLIAHSDQDISGAPLEDLVRSSDPYAVAAGRRQWGPAERQLDGETWYGSSGLIETTGWTVVVQVPESAFRDSIREIRMGMAALTLLTFVVLVAGLVLVPMLRRTRAPADASAEQSPSEEQP